MRACAVEMQTDIAEEPFQILYGKLQEKWPRTPPGTPFSAQSKCRRTLHKNHLFCTVIYRKNGRGHLRGYRFVRACAIEMHMDEAQQPLNGNVQEKRPGTPPGTSFCACLRSRNALGRSTTAILYGNLEEKRPGTPPGTSFCANLRSRNAHGHVTRGILCGNLEGKCRTLSIPPRLNTGP